MERGWIGLGGLLTGVLVVNPILLFLMARLAWAGIAGGSTGLIQAVTGAGNLPPAPSFSAEEAMVLQGRIEEARAAYEARLAADPGSVPVRFALAALHRDHRRDDQQAARLLHEIRRLDHSGGWEDAVANALIDLYERTGDRGRLMAEYARLASRRAGTAAGEAARRRLAELRRT